MNTRFDPRNDGMHADTGKPGASADPGAVDGRDASVGSLLRELAHEVPSLMSKEVALAKSEARESLEATKRGIAAVATGGAVVLGGFIILLLAAVYALSNVVDPWLAALIVGGITLVVGLVMVEAGKKKFEAESLKPDRTMDALHRDKTVIKERTS